MSNFYTTNKAVETRESLQPLPLQQKRSMQNRNNNNSGEGYALASVQKKGLRQGLLTGKCRMKLEDSQYL